MTENIENSVFENCLSLISRQADRIINPEARNEAYQKSKRFAREQPFAFVSLKSMDIYSLLQKYMCTNKLHGQSLIVVGLTVIFSPILTIVIFGLFAAICFWSLLACLTFIILSPALVPIAVIAATIWLSYTTVRWSADLFAKVPVGSGNEGNKVHMRPEAEANGNQAHAKLELNLFKVEEKGASGWP